MHNTSLYERSISISYITIVVWYIMGVDPIQFQMGQASQRKWSHIIGEFMTVEEGLSCEEQTYYVYSKNTIRIVEVDRLFSENDKLFFSVSIF